MNPEEKLKLIHNNLIFNYGSLNDEYPEQLMTITYLTGNEKVLELGGNIGRNSMIIASILKSQNNDHNYVSCEINKNDSSLLELNRNNNNFNFHIFNGTISPIPLICKYECWKAEIQTSEIIPLGYYKCNTVSWNEFKNIYDIDFDTLILDCEGGFYSILKEYSEILNNIKLIIMENDYSTKEELLFVQDTLEKHNFSNVYSKPLNINNNDDNMAYIYSHFFEVWIRK